MITTTLPLWVVRGAWAYKAFTVLWVLILVAAAL